MPLHIVRNDITKMDVDVIVNAANTKLQMGGGVCGAIFHAADAEKLKVACDKIGHCSTGEAVITDGFQLPAKHIIHTSGPIWQGGQQNESALLASCYKNSLELATAHQCESIAFPLISAGIYGYPKEQAFQIATSAIYSFLMEHEMNVYLVIFDKDALAISEKRCQSITQFIDENYVAENDLKFSRDRSVETEWLDFNLQESSFVESQKESIIEESLEDALNNLGESFSESLLRLIDAKGMTDVETYKNANIDRRLFSKIRSQFNYIPKKKTAIALAIALKLDLVETNDLLSKAGYTLSTSSKFDVIIQFFIINKKYNIFEINEALFAFDQILLGS